MFAEIARVAGHRPALERRRDRRAPPPSVRLRARRVLDALVEGSPHGPRPLRELRADRSARSRRAHEPGAASISARSSPRVSAAARLPERPGPPTTARADRASRPSLRRASPRPRDAGGAARDARACATMRRASSQDSVVDAPAGIVGRRSGAGSQRTASLTAGADGPRRRRRDQVCRLFGIAGVQDGGEARSENRCHERERGRRRNAHVLPNSMSGPATSASFALLPVPDVPTKHLDKQRNTHPLDRTLHVSRKGFARRWVTAMVAHSTLAACLLSRKICSAPCMHCTPLAAPRIAMNCARSGSVWSAIRQGQRRRRYVAMTTSAALGRVRSRSTAPSFPARRP